MGIAEFWESVCKITPYESGLAGLRNTLFTCHGIPFKDAVLLQIKSLLISGKTLFSGPICSRKHSYNGNRYLIYVPFLSPSNWGNLKPVLDELLISKKPVTIITGNKVLIEGYSDITKYPVNTVLKNVGIFIKASDFLISFFKSLSILARSVRNRKLNFFLCLNLGVIWNNIFLMKIYSRGFDSFFSVSPDVFLSTSEYFPVDFTLYEALKKKNCFTFLLQHGTIGISHSPFFADKMITWGPAFTNQIKKTGINTERLFEGGMPSSDILFNCKKKPYLKHNKKKIKVLILSETHAQYIYPEIFRCYKNFLYDLFIKSQNTNIEWVIKLHPAESRSFYTQNRLDNFQNVSFIDKNVTLIEAFSDVDVACTLFSTAGLEAIIYGIPLLVIKFEDSDILNNVWWPEFGGGKSVENADEFFMFINVQNREENFLNLEEKQKIFFKNTFFNQGHSGQSIKDYLAKT